MTTDLFGKIPDITRRSLLAGTAAAGGLALLPATVRAQARQPRSGGTLRAVMPFNPAALDPLTGRNNPDFNALLLMFDALIGFDPQTLELQPMLATSWKFADPTTLVLELRQGVEFHDGTPFNAEAVVFHLQRCSTYDRSNVKSDLAVVDKVEATGPYQVSLKLKYPDATLPAILTDRAGLIVSPASVKAAAGGNVDRAPVGTGPFKFVEWQDNTLIKVVKNANYWGDKPYLDGVDMRIVNEFNTAVRTVTAGEADIVLNMSAQQMAVAKRDPKLVAEATPSMIYYTAFLNYGEGPLKDVRVRQAMNWALDRPVLNQVLWGGLGGGHCSMFPSGFWANDPATENYYKLDLDRAKSLLKAAGFANGIEIATFTWADQAAVQRQEVVGAQLAEAGIRLKVTPAQPAQTMQYFLTEKKGQMLITPTGGLPDPATAYDRQFSGTAYRNAAKIELPGYRELMDASMNTFDNAKRKDVLFKMQRFVLENALHLPQFSSAGIIIRTPKVHGFNFSLLQRPRFHKVWMEA
ncbi:MULTISPECIES: ABC transporter substrate-binding protein [unclassified Neorhizobium]|uniref:ABC transporter substrate-binding protein n=1 Tax=unclassified Neorhizobium TaxID=2629175 RepID=UPI001FF657EB|nr:MULTISPECIES: ABC transporter substrate-binding protein [unclassified Neorhizobium]MCJ9669816.1 ABC transporter substrate-binding protein [Neorhizobium sp. SHOUNA12B]MCJ9746251.1 ABC transporter substrate-binding protein [Neorhizobium sp. SHOUNA12A]